MQWTTWPNNKPSDYLRKDKERVEYWVKKMKERDERINEMSTKSKIRKKEKTDRRWHRSRYRADRSQEERSEVSLLLYKRHKNRSYLLTKQQQQQQQQQKQFTHNYKSTKWEGRLCVCLTHPKSKVPNLVLKFWFQLYKDAKKWKVTAFQTSIDSFPSQMLHLFTTFVKPMQLTIQRSCNEHMYSIDASTADLQKIAMLTVKSLIGRCFGRDVTKKVAKYELQKKRKKREVGK